jgi:hypothetical protein
MLKSLLPGAAAVVAVIAIGCGGSSSGESGSDTTATTVRAGGDQQAVRDCLEKAGIDMPQIPQGNGGPPPDGEGRPPGGGPGFFGGENGEKIQRALKDCGIQLPERRVQRRAATPGLKESIQTYAACVRRNGYDLPDPNLSGDGPIFDEGAVDRDDPAFAKASKACQDLLRPSGGTPSSGGA